MGQNSDPAGHQRQPTLYLMVGLPGAGKTTRAREIEAAEAALRLTPDEWILALYGDELDREQRDAVRAPMEAQLWRLARRLLGLGQSVILDFGFWSRAERAAYRAEAERLGARVRLEYLEVPLDQLWARIAGRAESQAGTLVISRAELEEWAGWFEPPSADELAPPATE